MSADFMEPGPVLFGGCPTCGTITFSGTTVEARPFIGIPTPTSEEIDTTDKYEGLLLLEPRDVYDKCIIGVVERFNDRFILYSKQDVLAETEKMMEAEDGDDSMSAAVEWFEFNMLGAYVGAETPGFLEDTEL